MPLIDRLRQELDRAGRSAQRALDEGRIRLDLFRARQSVDRFAQRFGYAVYRAKKAGTELPAEELAAHMNNLTASEAEVERLETILAQTTEQSKSGPPTGPTATPSDARSETQSTSQSSPPASGPPADAVP